MHKTLNSTRQLLYSIIRERVTPVALTLITQEHQFADNYCENSDKLVTITSCNPCAFRVIYGLPCRHILIKKFRRKSRSSFMIYINSGSGQIELMKISQLPSLMNLVSSGVKGVLEAVSILRTLLKIQNDNLVNLN